MPVSESVPPALLIVKFPIVVGDDKLSKVTKNVVITISSPGCGTVPPQVAGELQSPLATEVLITFGLKGVICSIADCFTVPLKGDTF